MSVLIKDMEKPKSCYAVDEESEYCPLVNTDDDCILLLKKGICGLTWKEQYSKCPLVEAPEQCEDVVSRRSILDKISKKDNWEKHDRYNIGLSDAMQIVQDEPPVTPKPEPCEDAVSRQRLLTDLKELIAAWKKYPVMAEQIKGVEVAIRYVELIPPVTPKRKTGKCVHEIVNSYTEKTYCSECGKSAPFVYVSDDYYGVHAHGEVRKTDFCPHCGADMRGDNE